MKSRLLIVLICGLWVTGFSQTTGEASLFRSGMDAYKSGNFTNAQSTFLRALQEYPNGQLVTSMRYMLARSYYQMNDFSRTEIVAKFFFSKHPESSYLDDMHQLLGNSFYKQRNYEAAIDEWVWVLGNSKDPRLKQATGDYIFNTMNSFFTISQIEQIRVKHQNPFLDGVAQVAIGRKLLVSGENGRANSVLSGFLQSQPDHAYAGKARELLGAPVSGSSSSSRTFLYLQDTDANTKDVSEALALGMQYALDEYRQRNPGSDVDLKIQNVSPSVYNAVSAYKESMITSSPVAVVSPVDVDQTAALAALAAYEERPFIAPLSSQTGLADLNKYIFQINPDARSKGQFFGNYAAQSLQLKRLAVLAPANQYGETFVQNFVEAAQGEGASVESIQWYYEDTEDFNAQFRAVWRKGIFLAFRDSLLGAEPDASQSKIDREYRAYLERTFQPRRPGFPVDSTDVASTGLDGLLIVIRSPEFIPFLAPQLAFNNIKATLLGNEGWNDVQQLRKFRDYLEGMVFISPGYFDPESSNYRLFMNRFRNAMKATPERFHLLGYDTMKWMLDNYSPGISSNDYRDRLEKSRLYQGLMQSIQFGSKPRVNSKLSVLKLNYGQVIPISF